MPASRFPILTLSRAILRVLIWLNLLFLAVFAALLTMSFLVEGQLLITLARIQAEPARLLVALRLVVLIGMLAVPPAHLILSRLLAIVETVRTGMPFAAENARRLTLIAWGLLGLQLLDLAFGAVTIALADVGEDGISGWTFSVTGWLAVLLLFVLARVFESGARMRQDLEGTV